MSNINRDIESTDKTKSMEISTSNNPLIPTSVPIVPFNKQLFWLIIWMFK
jgi:hypothetical protein